MQYAINITSSESFFLARRLYAEGHIQFAEMLVDSFMHLDPKQVLDDLQGMPLSFHVMGSKFLEAPLGQLVPLAKALRRWISVLKPLYVSDHLLGFSLGGSPSLVPRELDYKAQLPFSIKRVRIWQSLLESQIHLENYPSLAASRMPQAEFFFELLSATDAQLLFDVSNAIVAAKNGAGSIGKWRNLVSKARHFHVGGYSHDKELRLFVDSHSENLDGQSLAALGKIMPGRKEATLVIERDRVLEYGSVIADIKSSGRICV